MFGVRFQMILFPKYRDVLQRGQNGGGRVFRMISTAQLKRMAYDVGVGPSAQFFKRIVAGFVACVEKTAHKPVCAVILRGRFGILPIIFASCGNGLREVKIRYRAGGAPCARPCFYISLFLNRFKLTNVFFSMRNEARRISQKAVAIHKCFQRLLE